jgi:hypothetical protein
MKLTRNLKILIVLFVSAYLIDLSNGLKSEELETEAIKEQEHDGIFMGSMKHKKIRTSTESTKKSTVTTQSKAKAQTTASAKAQSTAAAKAQANATAKVQATATAKAQATATAAKAKAAVANKKATVTNTNKNTNTIKNTNTNKNTSTNKNASANKNTNKNKQPLTSDTMGADRELLKQTGLLAAAMAAGKQQPGFKKKIDLEKMGPIAFHSWVKFFKYKDQVASDKNAKIRFNQNRQFFSNGEFREQLKFYPGEDYQKLDDDGEFKYVSDPNRFYLIAFKSSVVIYQTKIVNLKKINLKLLENLLNLILFFIFNQFNILG